MTMSVQGSHDVISSSVRLVQADPGPSPQIIRRFSDRLAEHDDREVVSEGLRLKVSHDRRQEERLELLHRDWALLLADADHLAQLYEKREPLNSPHLL